MFGCVCFFSNRLMLCLLLSDLDRIIICLLLCSAVYVFFSNRLIICLLLFDLDRIIFQISLNFGFPRLSPLFFLPRFFFSRMSGCQLVPEIEEERGGQQRVKEGGGDHKD